MRLTKENVKVELEIFQTAHPNIELREANAEFIVKAVNNHETLVSALQGLVQEYKADEVEKFLAALTVAEEALKAIERSV